MKTTLTSLLSIALLQGVLSSSAIAQAAAPSDQEIANMAVRYHEAVAKNREARKNYTWQYRTEVWENNVLQWVDLMNANLDNQGKPIFTQVNREQIVATDRGLFGKPKSDQQEGFEQKDRIIEYVKDWIIWYNNMPLSRVTELFDQAAKNNTVKNAHPSGKLIHVSGRNIRDSNANDKVSLWVNVANGHPVQMSFTIPVVKSLDGATGETIQATIAYRYLMNGEAFYADHAIIDVPSRKLRVKVENLNMQKKL